MENGWKLFNDSSEGTRGHNGNCINFAWGGGEIWELSSNSRFDWNNSNQEITVTSAAVPSTTDDFMFSHLQGNNAHHQYHSSSSSSSIYVGSGGSNHHPDPHLTCLKLGKRHYFENATPSGHRHVADLSIKKGEPYYAAGGGNDNLSYPSDPTSSEPIAVGTSSPATVVVPKCRVDGCHVALVNTKEYHRRHKVCELHSKAPKVIVHGLEQRFCQQCSRFHVVSEFDEAKRSCRRRLAGHNQRRRKTSHEHSLVRNSSQGRALSLLSLKNNDSWTSLDLSSRCSAALQDLIAEHRAAALLTRQLLIDERESWQNHHNPLEEYGINRTSGGSNSFLHLYHPNQILSYPQQVTLNLMHHDDPSLAYGFLSVEERSEK